MLHNTNEQKLVCLNQFNPFNDSLTSEKYQISLRVQEQIGDLRHSLIKWFKTQIK